MTPTLRDQLAMAALAGGLQQDARDDGGSAGFRWDWSLKPKAIAARAYDIADAMLAARKADA